MIIVAGFGMVGLSMLPLSRRAHEIGIHKVLGASPSDIFWLLIKEFVYTVITAAVIAVPITYITVGRWLDSFSFQAALPTTILLYSILIALFIVFFNICQTFRTMISDSIQSLRSPSVPFIGGTEHSEMPIPVQGIYYPLCPNNDEGTDAPKKFETS